MCQSPQSGFWDSKETTGEILSGRVNRPKSNDVLADFLVPMLHAPKLLDAAPEWRRTTGITQGRSLMQRIHDLNDLLQEKDEMRSDRRVVKVFNASFRGAAAEIRVDGMPRVAFTMPTVAHRSARDPRVLGPTVRELEAEDAHGNSSSDGGPNILGLEDSNFVPDSR